MVAQQIGLLVEDAIEKQLNFKSGLDSNGLALEEQFYDLFCISI